MVASKTCLIFVIFHVLYVVSSQEVVKRVPQGFVGMRGKKYTDSDSVELEHFFKRKPQFFVGVKGKKSFLNNLDNDAFNYKRAPMGFVGMRGKKDFLSDDASYYPQAYNLIPKMGSLVGQIDYSTNDDKVSDASIVHELLSEYLRKLESTNSLDSETKLVPGAEDDPIFDQRITNEVDKRAANFHQFFGVRGKKSIQNKRPYDLTFRGKFIGVRGKKDTKISDNVQELKFLLDQNAPWPKRKTQMGFFGMRGKKWNEDESSPEAVSTN